jgi:hypothetical protein
MRPSYSIIHSNAQRRGVCRIRVGSRFFIGIGIGFICLCLLFACAHRPPSDPQANLFEDTLQIYRGPLNHLSAVRRGVCPMHPSCSEYGRQAVQKHGFLIGWAMTMDRLLRCGRDELKHSPRIWVAGDWKFYDPVSANDNWWYTGLNQ